MTKRTGLLLILWVCMTAGGVHLQTTGLPLRAYGYITPPKAPEDWSVKCSGTRPRDCDRPGGMPSDTSNNRLSLPGSDRTFTIVEITAPYNPADWFPNDHPPMPEIVAHGKQATGFRACAICHYPNGQGLMQNAPVAGLPIEYFLRQIADFASGRRKSADLNKANAFEMAAMARNLTPEEARAAADTSDRSGSSRGSRSSSPRRSRRSPLPSTVCS